jgi:hypothetical protein
MVHDPHCQFIGEQMISDIWSGRLSTGHEGLAQKSKPTTPLSSRQTQQMDQHSKKFQTKLANANLVANLKC